MTSLLRRHLLVLLLAASTVWYVQPSAVQANLDPDFLKDHFYSQAGKGDGSGYFVLDDGNDPAGHPIEFFTGFRRFGGSETLGYPISRRFTGAGGFVYQAFQRGVLQWRPESSSTVLANTYDWLQQAGRDQWLDTLGLPPPIADDGSGGDWNKARDTRLGWLTEPRIKAKFLTNPSNGSLWHVDDAIQLYGLPVSQPERRGPFLVQRFQRVALQLWLESVPGMPEPGTVVGVLGGDMLKQSGLIPAHAASPESADGKPVLDLPPAKLNLPPAKNVKALYLSIVAAGRDNFRQRIYDLAASTEVNAVVVDVKSERGFTAYRSEVPLAKEIGAANQPTVNNFSDLIVQLHQRGLYVIARLPVFKDDLLATSRPALAVADAGTGAPWRDAAGLAWTDPFNEQVWDYNVALAQEVARLGVDEIQFDFIRFPIVSGLRPAKYLRPNSAPGRSDAIVGFLAKARAGLAGTKTKLAADLFGYTAWRDDDMGIGQQMDKMAKYLDVVSPMLYPSTFTDGIPGYRAGHGVLYPYEIVSRSAQEATRRLGQSGVVVRPWLQDFPDYAYDKRPFTAAMVAAQIRGAMDGGAAGWMLWDPTVRFTHEAIPPK